MTALATDRMVDLALTRSERNLIREQLGEHFEGISSDLGVIRGWRSTLDWCVPLLDAIGWTADEGPRLSSLCVTVPADPFVAFLREQHGQQSDYVEDCAHRLERTRSADPEWLLEGMTLEQNVAKSEGELREARFELALLEGILSLAEATR